MRYSILTSLLSCCLMGVAAHADPNQRVEDIYANPFWVEAGTLKWFSQHASEATEVDDQNLMRVMKDVGRLDEKRVLIVPGVVLDEKSYKDIWDKNGAGDDDLVMFLSNEEREGSWNFAFGQSGAYDFDALSQAMMAQGGGATEYESIEAARAGLGYSGFVAAGLLSLQPDGPEIINGIEGLGGIIVDGTDKWCMPPWIMCK